MKKTKFFKIIHGPTIFIILFLLIIFSYRFIHAKELWSSSYDAAKGILYNLTIEDIFEGYTGEGYIAGWNADDQSVDIPIIIPKSGHYTFSFRYSAAAGNATRYLRIGDVYELDKLYFSRTEDWEEWKTLSVNDIHLTEGEHTVSLIFNHSKGSKNWLNYDQLIIYEQDETEGEESFDFDRFAQLAQDSLYENFWNDDLQMFNNEFKCNNCNEQFHYWWQAHAVDVLIDGYERTLDDSYIERATNLFNGIIQKNRGIKNHFYDDMEWMGLALLRLYNYTKDEVHKDAVLTLWRDIKTGWNEEYGGGIAWNKSQLDYKNTPSNAPAVIFATRLYEKFEDEEYIDWAREVYEWQINTLVDPETGIVWDGVNREGNGEIDKEWLFTYNQGVFIGASLGLYKITGETKYMDHAFTTMEATMDQFVNHNSIIYESGSGDGGLFKGILIRYLTELALEDVRANISEVIFDSAKSAWEGTNRKNNILFGSSWLFQPDSKVELSQQLSGVMLMEHAALLKAKMNESSKEANQGSILNVYSYLTVCLIGMIIMTIFSRRYNRKR